MNGTPGQIDVEALLNATFTGEAIGRAVQHYREMSDRLLRSDWETCIGRGGKFVEAILKALCDYFAVEVGTGKDFKVDNAIKKLGDLPAAGVPISLKLTIPRACRFIYDVSSNRGARHDSEEIDPNVMDAHGVSNQASWILAELIRVSQPKGSDLAEAVKLVAKLAEKKYPLFERIEGRPYFANPQVGGTKLALLLLNNEYPNRIDPTELTEAIVRHGLKRPAARMGVKRVEDLVDKDEFGKWLLRAPGRQEAEALIAAIESGKI